jgi:CHAT domain-containing protein
MSQSVFLSSIQRMYRSLAVYCSLILSISLPLVQIQASPSMLYAGMVSPAQEDQQARQLEQLEPGKPIERELAGGQSHSYRVTLDAGQYLRLLVDQRGIDVVVQLLGPDGKLVMRTDSDSRSHGEETVEQVAEAAGSYRLTVQPRQKRAAAGGYQIRIEEVRAATEDDRALQEARDLFAESGRLYRAGKQDEAFSLIERVREIRERVLGPDHHAVASVLRSQGAHYLDIDDYAKAEQLFQRALTIYQESLGPEHPKVAGTLNDLALVYEIRGDYAKAEPLFKQALTIWEKTLGPEHPNVSLALNDLASLYKRTGEYAKAEPLYQHSLTVREKRMGPEDPSVAQALNDLADYYLYQDEVVRAEPLYQRALAILEKALGPEHINLTGSLDGLAAIYGRIKSDYAKAEQLHQRSLAIWEKTLGPENFHIAPPLENFAHFYYDKGKYAKAEPLLKRALAIYEKSYGLENVDVARILGALAVLYTVKGDIAQSITVLSRVSAVSERILARNLAAGSERQKLAYLALFSRETDLTLSLHSQAAPNDPQALNLAFTTLLRRKGRGLDAMADTIATLRRHATPQNQMLFDQLTEARSRLAALTLKVSGDADPYTYQARLKPLEEKIENLEADLSARSAEFRAQSQPVTLAAVQAALPARNALIEFAVYTPQELRGRKSKPARYLAYLLAPQGQPRWVDLGEAAPIDHAVDAWRKSLHNPNRPDVKQLARDLDDKIMRPVRSLLREMPVRLRRLLIAPDGSLNLIPFAALVDEENRYLVERYSISYLTSGRDLLRLQTSQSSKSAPLVVANPTFDKVATIAMRGGQRPGKSQAGNQERTQVDPTKVFFRSLPGTQEEALAVKAVLPEASVLQQEQATETAVKQARAPRFLHIATHGFFLDDQETPPAEIPGAFSDDPLRISDQRLSKWAAHIKDPLLRSGLALAGANQGRSGDDDGLLTALEMAGLDLWGTKLVVLSACDTGVGEVRNGEGVQGLRRALVLAGSESQIMSLWSVLDNRTKDLIIPYYRALHKGEGRSDGMRHVQLQMLRSKEWQHPFYWAAFILSGEWRALDGPEGESERQKAKGKR